MEENITIGLRVLHPEADECLYRQAWQWRRMYPRLVRKWDGLKHFKPWFKRLKCRVSVGVFNPRLVALVTLRALGNDIYEVDVDCERRVSRETLVTALLSIQRTVFEEWQAREVFCGIISRNQGIIRIAQACGFTPDGIEEQVGRLKFIRLRMTASEYLAYVEYENKYQHGIDNQSVPAYAGCEQSGYRQVERHAISS